MIEERKRSLDTADSSGGAPLKRMREEPPGVSNGLHDEDEASPAFKDLEAYRKEAIYRRMLEAQRDVGRADRRIHILQRQAQVLEERASLFSKSWIALVAFVEGFADDARKTTLTSALTTFQDAQDTNALQESMQSASEVFRQILTATLASTGEVGVEVSKVMDRCHSLTQEVSSLRQEAKDQRFALDQAQEELHDALHKLRRAERQKDRAHAPGVWAVEHPNEPRPETAVSGPTPGTTSAPASTTPAGDEVGTPIPGVRPEASSTEGTPIPSSKLNALEQEVHDITALANARLVELDGLRQELVTIRQELERTKSRLEEAHFPSPEQVKSSPDYLEFKTQLDQAHKELQQTKVEHEVDRVENAALRTAHQNFERALQHEQTRISEDLKQQLSARNSDLTRLRSQRDDLTAKLNEYKSLSAVQSTQTKELRALVAIKERKAKRFQSELQRLHCILAAKAGDKGTCDRLKEVSTSENEATELDVEGSLRQAKESLQQAFDDLQARYDALLSSSAVAGDDVREQNTRLTTQIKDLRHLMLAAVRSEDMTDLKDEHQAIQLWRRKQELLTKLQAQADAADQTVSELCAEIDEMGAKDASEDREAEQALTQRVVEIGKLEDKVLRLTAEKAKADNKFFSAMRAKEAVEAEKSLLARQVDKQKAATDKFAEAEKAFSAQQALNEAEIKAARDLLEAHKADLGQLKSTLVGVQAREADARRVLSANEQRMGQLIRSEEEAKGEARRAEERAQNVAHELERVRKAAAAHPRRGSGGSDNAQLEALNSLLRCSSCKERYRNKVITKCMHTFCAECVESRIQTRQRKCPHCGLSFAISDVQPLYCVYLFKCESA